jgi:glycine dehydrogenase subunit 1
MDFTPHTEADLEAMLAAIGIERVTDLFAHLPEEVRLRGPIDLPPGLSEPDLRARVAALASRNRAETLSFVGAGAYPHFVPAAVDALASRAEFATAYTPYQPEVSQGTLQAIFEFQTVTSILLGTELANASMYDGASAAAEAVLMALRFAPGAATAARGPRALLHPAVRATIATYARDLDGVEIDEVGLPSGRPRRPRRRRRHGAALAAWSSATPTTSASSRISPRSRAGHTRARTRGVGHSRALALGWVTPPGGSRSTSLSARAVARPADEPRRSRVGLFGTRERFLRAMPGRIVGETVDGDGRRGFC